MNQVPVNWYSMNILKMPNSTSKGAIILSYVDSIVEKYPKIKDKFYLIERRAWRGLNESIYADIKLVEDLSYWEQSLKQFPQSICLDIGPADFVDTDAFRPLSTIKEYDGIQISSWTDLKRPELFTYAAGILNHRRFIKWGHFQNIEAEYSRRMSNIRLASDIGARIVVPEHDVDGNKNLPNSKESMNTYLNKACVGILTTQIEGINRFKMECLSAGLPVLVPSDASHPTKKHITEKTGKLFEPTPQGLAKSLEEVLCNLSNFDTRNYIISTTGMKNSVDKLRNALYQLSYRDKLSNNFNDIQWDGRNQSLIWGLKVFYELDSLNLR